MKYSSILNKLERILNINNKCYIVHYNNSTLCKNLDRENAFIECINNNIKYISVIDSKQKYHQNINDDFFVSLCNSINNIKANHNV